MEIFIADMGPIQVRADKLLKSQISLRRVIFMLKQERKIVLIIFTYWYVKWRLLLVCLFLIDTEGGKGEVGL